MKLSSACLSLGLTAAEPTSGCWFRDHYHQCQLRSTPNRSRKLPAGARAMRQCWVCQGRPCVRLRRRCAHGCPSMAGVVGVCLWCWAPGSRVVFGDKRVPGCPCPSQSIPQKRPTAALHCQAARQAANPFSAHTRLAAAGRLWPVLCRTWLQTHSLFLAAGPAKFLELLRN